MAGAIIAELVNNTSMDKAIIAGRIYITWILGYNNNFVVGLYGSYMSLHCLETVNPSITSPLLLDNSWNKLTPNILK